MCRCRGSVCRCVATPAAGSACRDSPVERTCALDDVTRVPVLGREVTCVLWEIEAYILNILEDKQARGRREAVLSATGGPICRRKLQREHLAESHGTRLLLT